MKAFISARLKERSTWVSILSLLGLCGVKIAPQFQEVILTVLGSIVSGVFMFTADSKPVEISKPSMAEVAAGVIELVRNEADKNLNP